MEAHDDEDDKHLPSLPECSPFFDLLQVCAQVEIAELEGRTVDGPALPEVYDALFKACQMPFVCDQGMGARYGIAGPAFMLMAAVSWIGARVRQKVDPDTDMTDIYGHLHRRLQTACNAVNSESEIMDDERLVDYVFRSHGMIPGTCKAGDRP